MVGDLGFFVFGIALVVLGTLLVMAGLEDREKSETAFGVALSVLGVAIMLAQGVDIGEGRADSMSDLPRGTYVVQGEINTGEWRALWLAPLDSASGRLYELPKELVSTNFGHYVQKKGEELKPFTFQK